MLFIEQILLIHQPDINSFWDSYRIVTTIYSDVEVIQLDQDPYKCMQGLRVLYVSNNQHNANTCRMPFFSSRIVDQIMITVPP